MGRLRYGGEGGKGEGGCNSTHFSPCKTARVGIAGELSKKSLLILIPPTYVCLLYPDRALHERLLKMDVFRDIISV